MTLWQNESKTLESIKEAKAHCVQSIKEAEAHCSLTIWEVGSRGVTQACSIQQSHTEDIQHLKEESLKEERKDQLNFVSAFQATLKACPPESCGVLIAPYHLLLGHMPMSNLFTIPPGASPSQQGSVPGVPSPSAPTAPGPLPRPKWQHHLPELPGSSLPSKTMSKVIPKGPPCPKWGEVMPLYKALMRSHQEAFSWDSHFVRKAREEYYKDHCLSFDSETSCDLAEVFRHMIETTGLLSSAIYEIQEALTGQEELQHANYALRTLPKGLRFFHAVSPSESPKVMGLMGIHHPDTLCCFNGVTHCPWCGKGGQNEGTIINHLRMVHYKLGLVSKKCFCCLSIMLEAIWHHGWKNCQPSVEGGSNELSSSA